MTKRISPEQAAARDAEIDHQMSLRADTLAGDIRDFLLDRMKHDHDPLPWNVRSERRQAEVIDAATAAAHLLVRRVFDIVSSYNRPALKGELEAVGVKDGFRAVVRLSASDPNRLDLIDAVKHPVMLVVGGPEEFLGERSPVAISHDQGDLGLGGDDGDNPDAPDGGDEPGPTTEPDGDDNGDDFS